MLKVLEFMKMIMNKHTEKKCSKIKLFSFYIGSHSSLSPNAQDVSIYDVLLEGNTLISASQQAS